MITTSLCTADLWITSLLSPLPVLQDVRPLVQRLGGHMQATSGQLQRAAGLSAAALGPEAIRQLVAWTEATPHR